VSMYRHSVAFLTACRTLLSLSTVNINCFARRALADQHLVFLLSGGTVCRLHVLLQWQLRCAAATGTDGVP
jgi:hypothetical protein